MIAGEMLYRFPYVLHAPSESTEPDKYMAETPCFPNCVAWGDTPGEAIETLKSVAEATIRTYRERGYRLPPGAEPAEARAALPSRQGFIEIAV